jgi:hypothetical protein
MEFRRFFGTLIIMGWTNPNHTKELVIAPDNFKYSLGIMNANEDGYVIFDPKIEGSKRFPTHWQDRFYSAVELLELIQEANEEL